MNAPAPPVIPAKESYTSDIAHAQLLSSRVQFQNGVWIVDDNMDRHLKRRKQLSGRCFSEFGRDAATIFIIELYYFFVAVCSRCFCVTVWCCKLYFVLDHGAVEFGARI